jgi:PAS domain-containing protein
MLRRAVSKIDNILQFPTRNIKPAAGIFTWILATDTVYCDASAAQSFGFATEEARRGLPLNQYLSRMHADDLPVVAKAIHDAIITGEPYQEDYRICRPDGSTIEVTAFGSCFRDASGEPSHYAGMIAPAVKAMSSDDGLRQTCLAAYGIAKRHGRPSAAKLVEALAAIIDEDGG